MPLDLARGRLLLFGLPRRSKLAYCLGRDARVPAAPKLALGAAFGVIVSPLDLPGWIPVLGQLDMLGLGVLALSAFVRSCPNELVAEHAAALKEGTSIYDRDRSRMVVSVGVGTRRFIGRVGRRRTIDQRRIGG